MAWLALGVGGLSCSRTLHLFFIRDVQTGLVWATKILTDPFHDLCCTGARRWRCCAANCWTRWRTPSRAKGSTEPVSCLAGPRRRIETTARVNHDPLHTPLLPAAMRAANNRPTP
jgi:hypothetical protein